jgi:hypothetical protein
MKTVIILVAVFFTTSVLARGNSRTKIDHCRYRDCNVRGGK